MLSLKHGTEICRIIKDKKVSNTVYVSDLTGNDDEDQIKHLVCDSKEKIQVSPPKGHFAMGVYGSSGVGKSFFISQIVTQFKKMNPDKPIYIFSPIRDDPAFVKLKAIYIKIDDSILQEELQTSEFTSGLCIFDDIESVSRQYFKAVSLFRDKCLEVGRHEGINIICVSHVIQAGNLTKKIINESDLSVVFPRSNFSAIEKLVKNNYGFGREDIKYLRELGKTSRWVCIKRSYPTAIISENEVKIV